MTEEEIIEMGMQAGISKPVLLLGNNLKLLTAFAKLVEEHEREACAKICDEFYKGNPNINYSNTIAICIRGRTKE
jgi:hypothetical protein